MKRKLTVPNVVFCVCGAFALAVLFFPAVNVWQEWRGYSAERAMLSAKGMGQSTAASLAAHIDDAGNQMRVLTPLAAKNAETIGTLITRFAPKNAEASRQLRYEIAELAAECGLLIDEIQPLDSDGKGASTTAPVQWYEESSAGPGVPKGEGRAFLKKFPAGETYRRPLMSIKCRAKYAQISRFFAELEGLSWQVAPVAFDITRIAESPASTNAGGDSAADSDENKKVGEENLLQVTIVLAT